MHRKMKKRYQNPILKTLFDMYASIDVNVMMRIQYSTLEKLDISNESDKAKDYTKRGQ